MNTRGLSSFLFIITFCPPFSYGQEYEYWELNPTKKDGKYGYNVYSSGNIVIDYQFEEAGPFYKPGLARVKKDGKYGFINTRGTLVIDFLYDDAGSFIDQYANVKKDGFWGYINQDGRQVIDFRYEMAFPFTEGAAPVMQNGKFGYIDEEGSPLTTFMFDRVSSFLEHSAVVMIDKHVYRLGMGDYLLQELQGNGEDWFLAGDEITAVLKEGRFSLFRHIGPQEAPIVQYDDLKQYSEGLIAVKREGRWGFLDRDGKEVISCRYEDAGYFSNGLANVRLSGSWGYIDHDDRIVISPGYEYAAPFKGRNAWVVRGNKVIPINREGLAIPAEMLQQLLNYQEGLAAVNINGTIGYIDMTGDIVIEPQFASAGDFHSGRASIWEDGWYHYINHEGRPAFDARYLSATDFCRGGAIVSDGYRSEEAQDLAIITYTIIDTIGRTMSDYLFMDIKGFHEGLVAACPATVSLFADIYWEGVKWGYFNTMGEEVIAIQFDKAGDFHDGCAAVKKDGYYFFIDQTGEKVSDIFFNIVNNGLLTLAGREAENFENAEYAIIDQCGRALSGWFLGFGEFRDGLAIVVQEMPGEGKPTFAIMNDSWQIISDYYDRLNVYNDELYMVKVYIENLYERYAFLDKEGHLTCEWLVGTPGLFSDNYRIVMKVIAETEETQYAIMSDYTGRITSEWYDFIGPLEDGMAIVELNNPEKDMEYGNAVIDKTGKRLCEWTEEFADIDDGFALLVLDKGYGLITRSGAVVKGPYISIYDVAEEIALIEAGKYYKYVDLEGNVFSGEWVDANVFSEGMAAVRQKKTNYGYISSSGSLVIPYQFTEAGSFSDGLAVVRNEEGYYGYVDKTGTMVIGFQFQSAGNFFQGQARVTIDSNAFYIDKTGRKVD